MALGACSCLFAVDPNRKWVRVSTEFVEVISDAPQRDAVEFAVQYSAFRYTLKELLGPQARKLPRATVVLFRSHRDFAGYFPSEHKNSRLTSISSDVDGQPMTAHTNDLDPEEALRTAFEFETGWVLRRMGYELPIWASQGTGKVFSTFTLRRGVCVLGDYSWASVNKWMQNPISWPRFFEINTASPEYRGGTKEGSPFYHSQVWALMHYLWLVDAKGSERFAELATALRTASAQKAAETVLGLTEKDLTARIRDHVRSTPRIRELKFDEAGLRAKADIGPVSHSLVGLYLADLLLNHGRDAQAEQEIAAVRAAEANNPRLHETMARAALRRQEEDQAAALYREAIALKTTNVRAYLVSAETRLNQTRSGNIDMAGGGGVFADEAIGELRRAIELDPANGEAYGLLARAFFVRPEITEQHITELAPGIALGDAHGEIRIYRGLLLSRLGKAAEAMAEFEAVAKEPGLRDDSRREAETQIAKLKYDSLAEQVQKLCHARKFTEARAELQKFSESLPSDSRVMPLVAQLRTWLDAAEQPRKTPLR